MVSLLKLQDWNSCASFRWSPDFHMSCNHWGTCRRPPFFGSHSLRNRAFKAALSFVGRNMSEHPMWNSINVLRPNKASQIKYVRVYSDWLLLRIQFFYHWEKMKVIGIYQKQHAHDCWTDDQVSDLAFLADSMKSSSSASFTGESSIEVGTTVGVTSAMGLFWPPAVGRSPSPRSFAATLSSIWPLASSSCTLALTLRWWGLEEPWIRNQHLYRK